MRKTVSYLLWPVLAGGCVLVLGLGVSGGRGFLVFNLLYPALAVVVAVLERLMPHERRWLVNDGQIWPDLGHTALSKGAVQILLVLVTVTGVAGAVDETGGAFWPTGWPIAAQILLGLLIAEFGLYWAHRLAHAWPLLWRFHSVHHSVTRLWFINTGRFHVVDALVSVVLSQPLLFLAGAPADVFLMVGAITAVIGILTHCNIEMRFGPLNWLFNTPGLHRWHHSMNPAEGDRNYGENLMIFDQIFGTWFNPPRRPPATIGISGYMPPGFLGQLASPFVASAAPPAIASAGYPAGGAAAFPEPEARRASDPAAGAGAGAPAAGYLRPETPDGAGPSVAAGGRNGGRR